MDGAEKYPEFVRATGVLPSDIEEASATRSALVNADTTQNAKKISSKQATAQRDETQVRVEQTMETIVAVACLVYRKNPELCARFKATLPKRPSASRSPRPIPSSPTTT